MNLNKKPLLTIAIPTYNRAPFLKELLETLVPQLTELAATRDPGTIELLISNNCSPDETHEVVETFKSQVPRLNYIRNVENIGSDNNFIQCFRQASGKFFYLLGDDDLLLPGAIQKIVSLLDKNEPDIVYLSSSPFTTDFRSQVRPDPLLRGYRIFTDARQFASLVNMMFVFISCIIVHKDRLLNIKAPPIELARGSCLIQLSWIFPLLKEHRMSICVFERLLAGRVNNGGYFNIATVSGINLPNEASRLLGRDSPIALDLKSAALRRWFPTELMSLREKEMTAELAVVKKTMDTEYGDSLMYHLFSAPVLSLPMRVAVYWLGLCRLFNKLIYIANLPDFWRSRKDY